MNAVLTALRSYFLAPALFAFLGLIPIVILLYLLKLRRTHVIISSTMLWTKSLYDLRANAPFQRLRKNLLLLLQILILLILVTALARPFVRAAGISGSHVCVLIDRSASMQTREGDTTRLELAKQRALEMVDDMRGGDKMMVVTFGARADVLCELTDDRLRLRSSIRSITAADTSTKIRDAVLVAHSLKLSVPDLRLVIITDGNIVDLDEIRTRAFELTVAQTGEESGEEEIDTRAFELNVVSVGETSDNAGIAAFSVREPLEGQADRQCFVLVHNEHTEPLETTMTLYFDDTMLTVEELRVPPRDDQEVLFALPDLGSGVLRAELDHEDALDVDNVAWLVLRPTPAVNVLVVAEPDSTGAFFLKRVLSLDPRVDLSAISPENYTVTDEYDLTIFDNFAPERLPTGTLLFFNSIPQLDGLKATGTIDNPPVLAKDSAHPMMRFLSPENVGIRKAVKLELPRGSRTLLSTAGGPLIADVSRGGQQILVVAFDIADSNWPLRLSFPLFMQNLLAWVPRSAMARETSVAAGQPLTIMPVPDIDTASVTGPDGAAHSVQLDPLRPTFFGDTEQTGEYVVNKGETTDRFAVNLLDRTESAVTPAETVSIGRAEVETVRGRVKQNKELWRWLVVTALCILMAEWWIYSRRAWI